MERGFFHPDRGYWQTVGDDVPDEVLDAYPEGTVEVPLKPGKDFEFINGEWTPVEPLEPSPDDYPLNRFQFEALIIAMGLSMASLETAISALPISDFEKAVAISRLRNAVTYNRDHPLVEQVRLQIGLTVEDLDAAWLQAAALN